MKKVISALLLCLVFVTQAFGEVNIPDNEIWYTSLDGNVITLDTNHEDGGNIVGNTYENGQGKIVFDKAVRNIWFLFRYCESLTSIIIPNSVDNIAPGVFMGCTNLWNIVVANGNIFYDSRNNCNAIIETMTNTLVAGCVNTIIPEDVTSIGSFAFSCSLIESITIPSGVTSLEEGAFGNCQYLREINIPDNVTSIGDLAFAYCYSLTDINIPSNVTYIGSRAFQNCTGLTGIYIPSSVTTIGSEAFRDCTGLTSVNIPSGVMYVGSYAFSGCTNLECILAEGEYPIMITPDVFDESYYFNVSLLVPTGSKSMYSTTDVWRNFCQVEEVKGPYNKIFYTSQSGNIITPNSFYEPSELHIVSNTYVNGQGIITFSKIVTKISSGFFYDLEDLTSVTLPGCVRSIESGAFDGCTGLTSIYIPSSVVLFAYSYPFYRCPNLTSIVVDAGNLIFDSREDCNAIIETSTNTLIRGCSTTIIPNSVTRIGALSFIHCSGLTNITIPNSVTSIEYGAFSVCSGLTNITIPNSVTSIGDGAFYGCKSLTDCYVDWDSPLDVYDIFYDCNLAEATLHVPYGTKSLYEAADVWKDFGTIVEEFSGDFIEITDGTIYTRNEEITTNVKYTRTFNNTNWQALYVPFSLSYNDFSEYMDIAWLNDTHMYDDDGDGSPDRTSIEFFVMKDGATEPNTPYLVRAKHKGDVSITIKDAKIYPAVTNPFECSTFKQVFTVKGTYTGVSGVEMMRNHYYAPVDGKIKYALNENASLKPQRWYMYMTNKDGSPVSSYATSFRMVVDGEDVDAEETSITTICDNSSESLFYSIDGKTIVGNPSRSGMYVTNNKKVIVK